MPAVPIRIGIDMSVLAVNPLTGVGVQSLNLMKAFLRQREGFEVRLFASSARPDTGHLRELIPECARARVVRWPTRLKLALWTSLEWPPIEWFTGPIDIAFGGFHLLPATRRALRTATVHDVAWAAVNDINTPKITAIQQKIMTHTVRRADAMMAVSESTRQDLIHYFGADPAKIHIVYDGVDMEDFTRPMDLDALEALKKKHRIREPYFIYIGNLEPRKNLPRLLEAYARVRSHARDCPQLVMVGPLAWMYGPVLQAIEKYHLHDHVVRTGFIPHDDKTRLLRQAYACVYPSLYEGFGLPVLEAMAAHVPVLTSNVSSLPEVIGHDGIMVDPYSIDAIEAGLNDLIANREAALKRADAALERARRFTWDNSAKALATAFKSLNA